MDQGNAITLSRLSSLSQVSACRLILASLLIIGCLGAADLSVPDCSIPSKDDCFELFDGFFGNETSVPEMRPKIMTTCRAVAEHYRLCARQPDPSLRKRNLEELGQTYDILAEDSDAMDNEELVRHFASLEADVGAAVLQLKDLSADDRAAGTEFIHNRYAYDPFSHLPIIVATVAVLGMLCVSLFEFFWTKMGKRAL